MHSGAVLTVVALRKRVLPNRVELENLLATTKKGAQNIARAARGLYITGGESPWVGPLLSWGAQDQPALAYNTTTSIKSLCYTIQDFDGHFNNTVISIKMFTFLHNYT